MFTGKGGETVVLPAVKAFSLKKNDFGKLLNIL